MSRFAYDRLCPEGKRRYETEEDAERTLGRIRTDRLRKADARGTRRGVKLENRTYYHSLCDGYHHTEMSRRQYHQKAGAYAA